MSDSSANVDNGKAYARSNDVSVTGNNGVPQDGIQEYMKNCKAHQVGISHEEMVNTYSDWAQDYDKDTTGLYNGPEILAEFIAKHYSTDKRQLVKILDVAAGTGRVGVELSKVGFKLIDALEPSRGMMDLLIAKNIYVNTYEDAIGYKPVAEIRSGSYDSVVIAGGMGEGHIPVQAVDEFQRIARQGGLIFIVMREEYLQTVEQYCGKLEPFMESLVEKGLWTLIERTVVPNYSWTKNGVIFVYKKL